MIGGPIKRDRTFFFADYQGQRQTIGRTVISTVPTALQRQGVFTEAIAGRVPVIYDPATGAGSTRSPFPGNTIPVARMDPVSRSLLGRYPQPTSAGTANNYRRVADEAVDQDLVSVRIDHRVTDRDQIFGRLTRFDEAFIPVTPLPDGDGVTTGTLGPQDTTSWSFASSYQRTISNNIFNELRVGDTRRSVSRSAAQLSGSASVDSRHSGDSVLRAVPEHSADLHDCRLSAARVAGQHRDRLRHQRHADCRLTHLAERATQPEDGRGPQVGAPQRRAAALADGLVQFHGALHGPSRHGEHRHAIRKLSARPGRAVFD